jgi:hypothetical protein
MITHISGGCKWLNGLLLAKSRISGSGDGDTFRGEGILAITTALLQSGPAWDLIAVRTEGRQEQAA